MKDDLKRHYEDMTAQLKGNLSDSQLDRLYRYHAQRVAEFQHERLIHLLVTLFFGLLTGACFVILVLVYRDSNLSNLTPIMAALVLITTILEIFYIAHYYRLENGTQKLYEITKKFVDKS